MPANQISPTFLSHYYEATDGPFRNLSDLPEADAQAVLARIRLAGDRFASRRKDDYLVMRCELELRVHTLFIAKGGRPRQSRPHYFVLGACPCALTWYPHSCELCIPPAAFNAENVSFT